MQSTCYCVHSLVEALVHERFEIAQRSDGAVIVERQYLHHLNAADVLHGIDPELGVVNAGPAHAARAAELCVLWVAGRDLKTEAELVVAGAERKRLAERLSRGRLHSTKIGPMLFSPIIFTEFSLRIFAGPSCPPLSIIWMNLP